MRNLVSSLTLTAFTASMIGAAPASHALAADGSSTRDSMAAQAPAAARTFFLLTRRAAGASGTSSFRMEFLTCEPTGGTHPEAEAACAQLLESDGALELPPDETICPQIYAPVRVTATGYWRHHFKHFRKTYSNGCVLRSRTGVLFQF